MGFARTWKGGSGGGIEGDCQLIHHVDADLRFGGFFVVGSADSGGCNGGVKFVALGERSCFIRGC